MTIEIPSTDASLIRTFFPLCHLPQKSFTKLCHQLEITTAQAGDFIFQLGQEKNQLIYLLDGKISLQLKEFELESVQARTEAARFALAHQIPRKVNACAETAIRYIGLDAAVLNTLQQQNTTTEDLSEMIVEEPEESSDDWMTTLLKAPIFRALPPANLQRILINLKSMEFKQGETIIKQGEPGDFYYLIKQGECLILRQPSPKLKPIKLGELKAQDTFGEDAIISGNPRSVSVIAKTDVSLLRLDKENFIELIKKPSLKFITLEQTQQKLAQGSILIDLRSAEDFKQQHLPNSINIPFFSLRMHLKTLDRKQPVIMVCDDGKTSQAAAFLLLRHKFDASILEGGMATVDTSSKSAPASFLIDDGVEIDVKTVAENGIDTEQESRPPKDSDEPGIDALQKRITELENQCAALKAEKQAILQKYQQLQQKITQVRRK